MFGCLGAIRSGGGRAGNGQSANYDRLTDFRLSKTRAKQETGRNPSYIASMLPRMSPADVSIHPEE
jgi:hypothetical protein